MIHYQLRCDAAHEFDGWFVNSEGFESQARRGLISCPVCADTHITRALMTPGIPRKGEKETAQPAPVPASSAAGGAIPDAVRAALQRLRHEVETSCEYVGADFANEARRIHHGETERRGIYGESSEEEASALVEEGIEIARVPWVHRTDS
ncbi:MAG TPA: DUF1178 family protein [Acidocella sp.]|jgi:hypothetical protein|nr:DUF1178 family protein [Acidocella sp.]